MAIQTHVVEGYPAAAEFARELLFASKGFSVEPWPDDQYCFILKNEPLGIDTVPNRKGDRVHVPPVVQ